MDYTEEVKNLSGDVKLSTTEPAFVGPYSIVYRGYLKSSGQSVAVKRMNGIRGATVRTIRRKVQREGWAWSLLLHRNILPFYGYIEDDERFQPYGAFVSPWYRRGDLGQYLQDNPSAHLADRLNIWQGVADGVAYLHGYSPVVIHGDLKPGNILVDDHGSAKICDFGLARVIMEEGKSGLTTTTAHTGTSRYLAYELVTEEAGIPTTSSDIYAAGCIGLEIIFRKIPYSHRINGNNLLWHIRSDMLEGRFPPSRPADSPIHSDPVWMLVLRCWAHDPVSRPQAHELSTHLEDILIPLDVVTHLGPASSPLIATQSQAGIQTQTHTPEGDTGSTAVRMEIDMDRSSGQSDPNGPRNRDAKTNLTSPGTHPLVPSPPYNLRDQTGAGLSTSYAYNLSHQLSSPTDMAPATSSSVYIAPSQPLFRPSGALSSDRSNGRGQALSPVPYAPTQRVAWPTHGLAENGGYLSAQWSGPHSVGVASPTQGTMYQDRMQAPRESMRRYQARGFDGFEATSPDFGWSPHSGYPNTTQTNNPRSNYSYDRIFKAQAHGPNSSISEKNSHFLG